MSLETRRVRGDLNVVFKFLNRSYTADADIFFEYDKCNRRDHSKKLFKRLSRLDIRKYVFGNTVTGKWNNLPQCCINCTTLNNFTGLPKYRRSPHITEDQKTSITALTNMI